MVSSLDIISFILAFAVLYFSIRFLLKMRQKDVFKERLKDLMQYREQLFQEVTSETRVYERPEDQPLPWLSKMIGKILRNREQEQEKLKKLFEKAGIKSRNAVLLYGIAKIIMILPPAVITAFGLSYFTQWTLLYKILAIISAALFGSYLVDFILKSLVNARQERIRKAFPDALDLMVICTEAGLSLTATIQRVAREISQVYPDLGYELALLSIELNMLSDQSKALQNFSDRMDSPYFKAIIANMSQAEQYGTPIAQTMRTISELFRQDRLLEAEERAAKLPVLLTLPMMLFIFPCIFIVILGPAIIKVMATFK